MEILPVEAENVQNMREADIRGASIIRIWLLRFGPIGWRSIDTENVKFRGKKEKNVYFAAVDVHGSIRPGADLYAKNLY